MIQKNAPLTRIGYGVLLLVFLLAVGCAKRVESPYDAGKRPPPPSSGQKAPTGKIPATQRPYTIAGKRYIPIASAQGYEETGIASWYGKKFHGRKTSNGETYNMYAMTAAHKTLPMGTWVKVYSQDTRQEVVLRVNDRGPFITGRIIDLSYTGAQKIGMVGPGTARVKVTALGEATSFSKETQEPVAFKPIDYWQGNFTVQVGAFKVKANAESYRKKLSATYLNAHIVPYEDDRGQFYRVRIGKFTNLNDADQFSERLMTEGFAQAFAVGE
ncbi:MAG: septal ring lytic transglycosylase RlpA family protein [Proteobacteria bacterium]|nr:septal ring lytic transglycosylase RlpA family protein [Pseudomonadota bacterium]